MSFCRTILAAVLSVALLASLTPVHAMVQAPKTGDPHACCTKDQSEREQQTPKKCCDSGACAMQCCGVIPATIEVVPGLVGCTPVVEMAMVRPANVYSLVEIEAIFHPPRA